MRNSFTFPSFTQGMHKGQPQRKSPQALVLPADYYSTTRNKQGAHLERSQVEQVLRSRRHLQMNEIFQRTA
ncbi:hypothetical protein LEMLEM_LOCUS4833 [Lemmus lemmus]